MDYNFHRTFAGLFHRIAAQSYFSALFIIVGGLRSFISKWSKLDQIALLRREVDRLPE